MDKKNFNITKVNCNCPCQVDLSESSFTNAYFRGHENCPYFRCIVDDCGWDIKKEKTSSTGNRINHLQKKHYFKLFTVLKSNEALNSSCSFKSKKEKFITAFTINHLPDKLIEDKSFQDLFEFKDFPSRITFSKYVEEFYYQEKVDLILKFKEVQHFILVIDFWSKSTGKYLGILVKYIINGKFYSNFLKLLDFKEEHKGDLSKMQF